MSEQLEQKTTNVAELSELDQLKQSNELWRQKAYRLEDENKAIREQLVDVIDKYEDLYSYKEALEKSASQVAELKIEQIDSIKRYIAQLEFKITPDDIRHIYDTFRMQDTLYKGPEHAVTFKVNENMELYELK